MSPYFFPKRILALRYYFWNNESVSSGTIQGLKQSSPFPQVNKEVLPLKANLAIQQIKLDQAMSEKEKAEAILREKNKEVAAAKAQLDTAERSQKAMLDEGNACKAKMDAATGLITGKASFYMSPILSTISARDV